MQMEVTKINGYDIKDSQARKDIANLYVKNINELKQLTTLNVDDVVKTLGYYEVNDGGSGSYLIREKIETDVEDNGLIHFIGESLVGELIIENMINAKQLGCKTDGSDISSILNNYFSKGNKQGLYFPEGNYSISSEIDTLGSVIMEHNAYLVALNEMDCCVHINKNFNESTDFVLGYPRNLELKINVECNELANTGIRTDYMHWNKCVFTVNNPLIYGVHTRYDLTKGHAENTFDIEVSYESDKSNNATAINIGGSDDIYNNITAINLRHCTELHGGDNSIGTIHSWMNSDVLWEGSTCLKVYNSKNHISELVCDTIETGIKLMDLDNIFALYIDFMFSMIHPTFISSDKAISYKIWNMEGISDNSLKNSTLVIENYKGNDQYTSKISLGGNGICPWNTKLGYSDDYTSPKWPYSLDYCPEGSFSFDGASNVKGKPIYVTAGNFLLKSCNSAHGKLQELMNVGVERSTGASTFNSETLQPSGNFIYFYKRVVSKFNIGNSPWGQFTSYFVQESTAEPTE